MIRAFVSEAVKLVVLAIFLAMILVWAAILAPARADWLTHEQADLLGAAAFLGFFILIALGSGSAFRPRSRS